MGFKEFRVLENKKIEFSDSGEEIDMVTLVNMKDEEIFKTTLEEYKVHHSHFRNLEHLILRGKDGHDIIMNCYNINKLLNTIEYLGKKVSRLEKDVYINSSHRRKKRSSSEDNEHNAKRIRLVRPH
jgi:hypothetical protein